MECFNALGLCSDASMSEIKKSYARLLKNCKPDQDPEGFKKLHAVYKEAQQYCRRNTQAKSDGLENQVVKEVYQNEASHSVTIDEYSVINGESDQQNNSDIKEPKKDLATIEFEAQQNTQIQNIVSKIDEIIKTNNFKCFTEDFLFLEQEVALLDPYIHYQVSLFTFERVVSDIASFRNANSEAVVKYASRYAPFGNKLLTYLANLLSWLQYVERFEHQLGEEAVNVLYPLISELPQVTNQPKELLAGGSRFKLTKSQNSPHQYDENLSALRSISLGILLYGFIVLILISIGLYDTLGVDSVILGLVGTGVLVLLAYCVVNCNAIVHLAICIGAIFMLTQFPLGTIGAAIYYYRLWLARKPLSASILNSLKDLLN